MAGPTANRLAETEGQTVTQCESIVDWLEQGFTLTPAEAYERFGTLALHSRIAELRTRGHLIDCELIKVPSGKWVGRYSLVAK